LLFIDDPESIIDEAIPEPEISSLIPNSENLESTDNSLKRKLKDTGFIEEEDYADFNDAGIGPLT